MKRNLLIAGVFLIALISRLYLTDKAWHVDMLSNAGWGEWIYDHGPAKFYANNIWTYSWPTQPPLINSIYAWNKSFYIYLLGRVAWTEFQLNKIVPGSSVPWLTDFGKWFGYGKINNEIPFQIGYMVTMKLIPIFADILIAILLYFLAGRQLKWAGLYLFLPFSWYVSSLWGQYDQVSTLLVVTGLYLMYEEKYTFTAPLLLGAAILIKPTALVIGPFFIWYYLFRTKAEGIIKATSLFLPLMLFWITTMPYTHKNPFEFGWYDLKRIVFEKSEPRVSTNAFNVWRVVIGDKAVNANTIYFGIPAVYWGLTAFAILNILAVLWVLKDDKEDWRLWEGAFLVMAGAWLLMTGMMDRYLFGGITLGIITTIKRPKILPWVIIFSLLFWLNLYYQWWIPESFSGLKQALSGNGSFLTRVLAILNLAVFVKIFFSLYQPAKWLPANSHIKSARPFGKQTGKV